MLPEAFPQKNVNISNSYIYWVNCDLNNYYSGSIFPLFPSLYSVCSSAYIQPVILLFFSFCSLSFTNMLANYYCYYFVIFISINCIITVFLYFTFEHFSATDYPFYILSRSMCDCRRGLYLWIDLLFTYRSWLQITITLSLFLHFTVHYSTHSTILSLLLDVSW
jgi:uncharacterized protein (DUF983 family)